MGGITWPSPYTATDFIHKELEKGFNVQTITKAHHPMTQTPLPLFCVELEFDKKNDEIFKLKILYYSKIRVEEPYKRREIAH